MTTTCKHGVNVDVFACPQCLHNIPGVTVVSKTAVPPVGAQHQHDEIWVTEDGRKIPVADLEEPHMRSIIRMILKAKRERFERKRRLRVLIDTLTDDMLEDLDADGKWGKS